MGMCILLWIDSPSPKAAEVITGHKGHKIKAAVIHKNAESHAEEEDLPIKECMRVCA
jgi:hypothetical protein